MGKKHRKSGAAAPRSGKHVGKQSSGVIEPLLAFASGPLVAEFVAGALGAGAQALIKGQPASARSDTNDNGGQLARKGAQTIGEAGKQATDMASLVGYAVAVAAGEIAARIIDSYEKQMGNGKSVQRTAKAARKAADVAWATFEARGDRAAR